MQLPFLNPWLLIALPAVGVPVIIHLLNRHKSVTIEWGAMDLLRKVMVFRSRQIRLEDLLLMAVRCLIVLLVILAVARPTTKWLPVLRNPDTGVVIAIDTSLSMQHKPGLHSRFDEALRRTREILGTMETGRPVTLVAMAAKPRVLLRNASYERGRVEEILKELKPSHEPLNLEAALAELEPLAREMKAPRREVYLVSDCQATTLGALSEGAKASLGKLSSVGQVLITAVPCASDENVAVTEFDLASGVLRVGAIAQFQATVRNLGRAPVDTGELSLLLNDRVVDRRFVGRIGAGDRATIRLYAPLERDGIARLTARLADDALPADSSRYAVINVRSALRVLCVDCNPMEGADVGPAALVTMALSPASIDRSEARPSVEAIPLRDFASSRLADYDVIVLVDVRDVPEERAIALRKFVEQGGGLILMAGRNTKPELLGQRFLAPGASLLPAEALSLGNQSIDQNAGTPLDLHLIDHPLTRALLQLPRELLGEARFYQFVRVRPLPDTHVVLQLASGEPILIERQVGRGKVLLWTSGPDRTWNNLIVNPAFPILLQQATTHLSRQPFETPVNLPKPILLPLPALAAGEEVTTLPPGGQQTVSATALRGGEVVVETAATAVPGFYQVQAARDPAPMTVAVNVDTAESDVKTLDSGALAAAFGNVPVRVIAREHSIAAAVLEARTGRELWQVLLAAAVLLIAAEALLSRWYSRRA